jgi:hypothetical protein
MLPLLRKSPAGRIVNVSSGLGSLTLSSDPASPSYNTKFKYIGYRFKCGTGLPDFSKSTWRSRIQMRTLQFSSLGR